MKRILLLLIATVTLGLTSCKKDTIIREEAVVGKTYNRTIEPNEWIRNPDGTFTYVWTNPVFDKVTLDDEAVLVYFSHPAKLSSDIQLPYTFDYDTYSYELYEGGMAFDIQNTINMANSRRPTQRTFVKVVVLPSQFVN